MKRAKGKRQTASEFRDAWAEMDRAVKCLYVAVDAEVADAISETWERLKAEARGK